MEGCNLILRLSHDLPELYEFVNTLYVAPTLDMKYDGKQRRKIRLSVTSLLDGKEQKRQERAALLPVKPISS